MRAEPLPHPGAPRVALRIDNLEVSVPEGTTVLQAAKVAGITVPSLCAHRELSPFGGCRLCAVEIEGMRGYPLACSTIAAEGMEVTTDSAILRETRREVLRLILSQHPSSCLICEEADACGRSQKTIHKAGVATGCRSCTNDEDCELQELVRLLGITDIGFPVAYRGLEPEFDDPFYDRDYNLCILCGRCVRMCQEVRGTAVLAFKYRGRKTLIGPSFGDSHVEAGCEFCGACVDVCPTGALAAKVSKWDGSPDLRVTSTCPFCFLGCRLELAEVGGRLSATRGALDPDVNDGQLCVRGAFCLPETTHHHRRLRTPMVRRGEYFRVATWDEALAEVVARVRAADGRVDMLVSSDLTNESLWAAQRFAREGLGAGATIDSSGRAALPGGPALWSRLFSLPISLRELSEADGVVVAGLDSRFSFSVVGVQARRAMRRGGAVVAVDARESNMALMADDWLRPRPDGEARALTDLLQTLAGRRPDGATARRTGVGVRRFGRAAGRLADARRLAVVVGPRLFDAPGAARLVQTLEDLADAREATIVPLTHGANIRGVLEMGALSEVQPGPRWAAGPDTQSSERETAGAEACDIAPRVLYLVGEAPFTSRPDCDFIVAQDLYAPPFDVDVFLPAASFAEAAGTITNVEGRVQELVQVDRPTADRDHTPLPDTEILAELAERLGSPELPSGDDAVLRDAIRAEVPGFPRDGDRSPRRMTPLPEEPAADAGQRATDADDRAAPPPGSGRFLLVQERGGFRHRGIDMAGVVEGLAELRLEDGLRLCPDDMDRLGVEEDADVRVIIDATATADGHDRVELRLPARADPDCPRGAAYVTRVEAWGERGERDGRQPLDRLPAGPLRVRISPAPGAAPEADSGRPASPDRGGR